MGAECVKRHTPHRVNSHSERLETIENQLRRCEENLHFSLSIDHLKLTNMSNKVKEIRFQVKDKFEITYTVQDFIVQEKLIKSEKTQRIWFELPANKLDSRRMVIHIVGNDEKIVEILKINLLHLCTGPVHHDHILKQMKARMMFDLHIYQNIEMNSRCQGLNIKLNSSENKVKLDDLQYRLSLLTQSQEYNSYSQKGQQNPDNLNFQTREVTSSIPNNYLKQANFKIDILTLSDTVGEGMEVICSLFVPYRRVQSSDRSSLLSRQDIDYTRKEIIVTNEPFQVNGKQIGSISFTLQVQASILYAEQMECLIYSEMGVTTVSPSSQESKKDLVQEIKDLYKRVKKIKSEGSQRKADLVREVDTLYRKFQNSSNGGQFTSESELYERQITLVKVLSELSALIAEGQEVLNERLWRIIYFIAHKPELTSRYLTVHQNQQTRSALYLSFYKFICTVLAKIIASTQTGITFAELQCVQKFISFAYFRFPWMQDVLIKAISRKTDPVISQDKLAEFGASRIQKSPSKSSVYDWEINVYNYIQNNSEFRPVLQSLEEISRKHPDWDSLLFNRGDEDLFYGLYVELWTEAQVTLKNIRGKISWEYFPYYGRLLGSFLGEMNNSKVADFSGMFKQCSNKLVMNEKLLNTFVNLLFPRTYLFEISCVLKCLNLLESYFEVISKNDGRLPQDFHSSCFYTGIRSIFTQNHSYLIVKTLLILYKYSDIFTQDFKKVLASYLLSREIFYHLFLHWCSNVRKMFHHLIYFKLLKISMENNPEESFRKHNSEKKPNDSKIDGFIQQDEAQNQRKLKSFIRNIEYESCSLKIRKDQQSKLNGKAYHERMKCSLKEKLHQKKELRLKKQAQQRQGEARHLTEGLTRKQSLFLTFEEIDFCKQRRMSTTDSLYEDKIQEKYLKYSLVSLKQYDEVKKVLQPNKEIENLSKLFQGDIDT